ncbi:hypothetical protein, unlikely [Trypanosoma brucei gambiense DAL972]|uniref:Uncharacterized protein n=1 Tax=Trypanosoma brucei gambiense (strain MHOM/CI/86/DAL972) TaxID=679716 RepID=C9ZNU8_TRYB9|nr:hypothetical protein, unlikely [Trypanosoma brucei gambiense DAL972]CBH11076.1 hypothetical protein, unlikely [Trypanosoma brucei gambiense DAL972]|eukprot:XP_011773363.1 hypothetical protein, unlikely [Trypanosoma brucei gambiense DAL972]
MNTYSSHLPQGTLNNPTNNTGLLGHAHGDVTNLSVCLLARTLRKVPISLRRWQMSLENDREGKKSNVLKCKEAPKWFVKGTKRRKKKLSPNVLSSRPLGVPRDAISKGA